MKRISHGSRWGVFGLVVALGCGGGKSTPSVPPSITAFTASPTSLPYGGGMVTLSWTVSGADSLSLSPAVGDVSGKSSSAIQVASSTHFVLTAHNSKGDVSSALDVIAATTLTVNGTVLQADGTPSATAKAMISGGAAVSTDANGHFSLPNVTPPYVLAVYDKHAALVLDGLTRSDPTVVDFGGAPAPVYPSATIKGSLTGLALPLPVNQRVLVQWTPASAPENGGASSDGTFSATARFPLGATSQTGSVEALGYTCPTSNCTTVTGFTGYGKTDNLTAFAGGVTPNVSVALQPVTTAAVGGTFQAEASLTVVTARTDLHLPGSGVGIALNSSPDPNGRLSQVVPVIPGSTVDFTLSAQSADTSSGSTLFRKSLSPGDVAEVFSLKSPPTLTQPASGTVAARPVALAWASVPGLHKLAALSSTNILSVVTVADHITLPDLSPLGFTWDPGNYLTVLTTEGPGSTVDAFAGASVTVLPPVDGAFTVSTQGSSFKVAP